MAPKSFFNASAQSDETQHGKKNDNKTDPPDNAVHIELLKMVKRLGYSQKNDHTAIVTFNVFRLCTEKHISPTEQ